MAVQRLDFEQHIAENQYPSAASADYHGADYLNTDIEIVLETLYDDSRLHLTEKILRPIACQQPFMVLAPAGSLSLLRSYGFKTFGHVWDESYDTLVDPVARMDAVLQNMQLISSLDVAQRQQIQQQCQATVKHNHKWFFSAEFANLIVTEFQRNLSTACAVLHQNCAAQQLRHYVAQGHSSVAPADLDQVWQWLAQRQNK